MGKQCSEQCSDPVWVTAHGKPWWRGRCYNCHLAAKCKGKSPLGGVSASAAASTAVASVSASPSQVQEAHAKMSQGGSMYSLSESRSDSGADLYCMYTEKRQRRSEVFDSPSPHPDAQEEMSPELISTQEEQSAVVSPDSATVVAAQAALKRAQQALVDAELKRSRAKVTVSHEWPYNKSHRDSNGKFASKSEQSRSRTSLYRSRQRCSICTLVDDDFTTRGCRCDYFPMSLPAGLAFGDVVTFGEKQAYALYFAPKGTLWGTNVKPWSVLMHPTGCKLAVDSIICLPCTSTTLKIQELFAAPASSVQQHYEEVEGWVRRPPSRYEPARLAASRTISSFRRKECFDQTLDGRHRCFSCFCLLVFTMDEEFRINTDPSTSDADKVRCHEAGHVYPHSKAAVEFTDSDMADALWNLIPLCHNCNCRMGRQQAFEFIDAANPAHRGMPEYVAQQQQFERNFPK
eukprot:COSAG02_NODE_934_length_15809_cov_59.853787_10_plen_460_part_00